MSVSNIADIKKFGVWKTVTLTATTTSAEVDLGYIYQKLLVLIPTLGDAGATTIHVAMGTGETFLPVYAFDADATADFAHATTSATTTKAVVFNIGGVQHIKVVNATSQTSETYYVRGINP